jgi:hypothetical protein
MKTVTFEEYEKAYRICQRFESQRKEDILKTLEETNLRKNTIKSLKKEKIFTVSDLKKYYHKYGRKLFFTKEVGYYSAKQICKLIGVSDFHDRCTTLRLWPIIYDSNNYNIKNDLAITSK